MHCPLSSPTPELLDGLCEFDFRCFLATFVFQKKFGLPLYKVFDWLKKHVCNCLTFSKITDTDVVQIKLQNHPSGRNVYSHHLLSLNEHLKSELGLFMTHSTESTWVQAAQLLVTAVMLPGFPRYPFQIQDILMIDLDPDSSIAFHRAFGHILYAFTHGGHLLLELLGDPTCSNELYVDGNKFAALATAFATVLFGPFVLGVYSDTASQNSERSLPQDDFLACVFSCLPDCLLKASPSKDLALFLQSHEIPSNLQDKQFDGHSAEATVAAINAYILRCKVSEDLVVQQQSMVEHKSNCGRCHVM
ncbi:hypothetical protein BYT27DRAFT_6778320 [Phlegmacium glaucopus]|nr:hypothetical protein BYT27DRAFT_6778320 [Phlegmacium glaucopus]